MPNHTNIRQTCYDDYDDYEGFPNTVLNDSELYLAEWDEYDDSPRNSVGACFVHEPANVHSANESRCVHQATLRRWVRTCTTAVHMVPRLKDIHLRQCTPVKSCLTLTLRS